MNSELRIILPPLEALAHEQPLDYLLLDRQGQLERRGSAQPAELARLGKGRTLIGLLDAQDAVQACLQMPPLPPARLADAVRCAVPTLVLGDSERLHVAHGPRQADGEVSVAWSATDALQRLARWSQQHGLRWRGLHAWPADGAQARLPAWGLHGGLQLGGGQPRAGWGWAAGCLGAALLVWVGGLNLYAGRLEADGLHLRQSMQTQVRQAFPHLPVILNPLQQARQQLQAGGGQLAGFEHLMQAAGSAMPFLAGAVQGLEYSDQRLALQMTEDSAGHAPDEAWQTALGSQGVEAQLSGLRWTLWAQPRGEAMADAH